MSNRTGPVDGGVDWALARAALQSETTRLTTMLRTVRRPTAPAPATWTPCGPPCRVCSRRMQPR
ncbi:MAG TPA: hypothetical protein VHU88_08125 [Sporichthyaceae bacterium]|nr:hypothetical protein [Sporichthyaceae bacterium]